MYSNNREAYRQAFYDAWQKHLQRLPLTPIEAQLVAIINHHPEYHSLFTSHDQQHLKEFSVQENPFLHMSLHLSIQDQYIQNRPMGIKEEYQRLLACYQDAHHVEHMIMDCLANLLWHAQQTGVAPDEESYLAKLRQLGKE
jgi:hypothetical protein